MKEDIFNQYVERVCSLFSIDKEQLFSKSKQRDLVDARHLLYYLCYSRPMQVSYITRFMNKNGYAIQHSSIVHGVSIIKSKMKADKDYGQVIKDMEKAVFI